MANQLLVKPNIVGFLLSPQDSGDFQLNLGDGVWGNDEVRASNLCILQCAKLLKIKLGAKLSAGALTLKLDAYVDGATVDFSSPELSLSVTGTAWVYNELIVSSATKRNIQLQGTAGASGCTLVGLTCEVTGLRDKEFNSLDAGTNALPLDASYASTVVAE